MEASSVIEELVNTSKDSMLYKLSKELKKEEGGPSEEATAWFKENVGKTISISGTDMEGIVVGLNTSTRGFYPGNRYPIYVTINKDSRVGEYNANGCTFEYGLEQLILINTGE